MILWVILIGGVFIVVMLPARIFGWSCGVLVRRLLRHRKPPTRPPI